MRKLKKAALLVTAFMCFFLMITAGRITTKAAAGALYEGKEINEALKKFTNEKANYTTEDQSIKRIVFAKTPATIPESYKKTAVGDKVFAYYNAGTVYIYYTAKMNFNANSDNMFYNFAALESVSFDKGMINTAPVTSTNSMFRNCKKLKALDLSQFNTPNLTNTGRMFQNCEELEQLNVSTLNTSKVTDMQAMFMACSSLTSLNVNNFRTSKVIYMQWMFEYCVSLSSLDLKFFDTSNVTTMYHMFKYCSELKTLNVSSFRTPRVTSVQEMFAGCENLSYLNLSGFDVSKVEPDDAKAFLGDCLMLQYVDGPKVVGRNFAYDEDSEVAGGLTDCRIGRVVIDDNKDGKADNSTAYTYFVKANKAHRYLFLDGIARVKAKNPGNVIVTAEEPVDVAAAPAGATKVKVKGVTYSIGADGRATVIKISSMKKVKIDSVTVNGVAYPVKRIGEECCQWNKKLKSITIGSNVESIGRNAFYGSSKLKNVTINANKNLKVEHGAFKKINRKAHFKVKGIKGKAKKKLLKKLKK